MISAVVDDLDRFAAEHFQSGVCVPADAGVRPRNIINAGRIFIPAALEQFRALAASNQWFRETAALAKTRKFPVIGRPENVSEFRQLVRRRRQLQDTKALAELLKTLQAERLALEREFTARSEELLRRD